MKRFKSDFEDGHVSSRIGKGILTFCIALLIASGCGSEGGKNAQHMQNQPGSVNDILEQRKSEMQEGDAQDTDRNTGKTNSESEGSGDTDKSDTAKKDANLQIAETPDADKQNADSQGAEARNTDSQNLEKQNTDLQGADQEQNKPEGAAIGNGQPDVDLTVLSATMVYAEVYQIMTDPDSYVGKIIKMKGDFTIYDDTATDKRYFTCIIRDATACCAQGIEFELLPEYQYPQDYPKEGSEITVQGRFELYDEDGLIYCTLRDSKLL